MSVPKSAVTSANRYLSRSEMETNATYIKEFFESAGGITLNAICAMLGNMESESTINPGIYESLDATSSTNGFGIVQWTPNTKYKTWADSNGYRNNYGDIDGQLLRILYEYANGLQWIPTATYPLSFVEFMTGTHNTEYLTQAFLYNYERPASLNQPNRSTQAAAWLTFFGGPQPTPTRREMSKLLLYFGGVRR